MEPSGLQAQSLAHIPKADIHLHQEAGPRSELILARREGRTPYDWLAWTEWAAANLAPGVARLNDWNRIVQAPADLDALPDFFTERLVQLLEESAAAGAVLVEVRFGQDTVLRPDFIELFRAEEESVRTRHPTLWAEPLATIVHTDDMETTERRVGRCLELANEGLAGVDFIPQPYDEEADWSDLYRWAGRLAAAGLGITVHAGEFSPANLSAALCMPGVKRLGHAVHAGLDPDLLEDTLKSGVTVECCLTSNVILGAVDDLENHPIRRLVEHGVPLTLNTDNPIRFGTSIDAEYETARRLGFSEIDLAAFTRNAVHASFTSPTRKSTLYDFLDGSVAPQGQLTGTDSSA